MLLSAPLCLLLGLLLLVVTPCCHQFLPKKDVQGQMWIDFIIIIQSIILKTQKSKHGMFPGMPLNKQWKLYCILPHLCFTWLLNISESMALLDKSISPPHTGSPACRPSGCPALSLCWGARGSCLSGCRKKNRVMDFQA